MQGRDMAFRGAARALNEPGSRRRGGQSPPHSIAHQAGPWRGAQQGSAAALSGQALEAGIPIHHRFLQEVLARLGAWLPPATECRTDPARNSRLDSGVQFIPERRSEERKIRSLVPIYMRRSLVAQAGSGGSEMLKAAAG